MRWILLTTSLALLAACDRAPVVTQDTRPAADCDDVRAKMIREEEAHIKELRSPQPSRTGPTIPETGLPLEYMRELDIKNREERLRRLKRLAEPPLTHEQYCRKAIEAEG